MRSFSAIADVPNIDILPNQTENDVDNKTSLIDLIVQKYNHITRLMVDWFDGKPVQ